MKQGVKSKVAVIVLAVLLVISLAINGILAAKLMNQPEDPALSLVDPEYAVGRDEPTTVPEETTEPAEEQVISARYFDLICPSDLNGRIYVDSVTQEDDVRLIFTATVEGNNVELFAISLTKAEPEDYILGQYQDKEAGQFYVGMRVNEINPEEWSEAAYDEINALQERVNDFIIQINENEGFSPSR